MPPDKFSAVWVSHSSIADFLVCPRAYYLKNVYKDPQTGHKIQLTSPSFSLGSAVHEVIESLSIIPTADRFRDSLRAKFNQLWLKYSGQKGGFFDAETEDRFKVRGQTMLAKIEANPGPLKNKAVKVNMDLPYFWLSEKDNLILSGKIDWLEYLEPSDSVHIIDFKTGKSEEKSDSLQLPIYLLLVQNTQKRPVSQASYWYLNFNDAPTAKDLPDVEAAQAKLLKIAKQIKLARQLDRLNCPEGGCRHCLPLEKIIRGTGLFVGVSDFGRDLYALPAKDQLDQESTIL